MARIRLKLRHIKFKSTIRTFYAFIIILLIILLLIPTLILIPSNISNTKILFTNNCELCSFSSLTNISSTKRDAIFTATTTYKSGIDVLIRSIRTTGCQARIIVFVTDNFEKPSSLQGCGVEYVNVGPLTTRVTKSPYKSRWEWYENYLSKHLDEFDRIFHTDAFDALFFGDPFSMISNRSKIYIQEEGIRIKGCPYNRKWLSDCHNHHDLKKIRGLPALCSGSLGGGARPFYDIIHRIVTHPEWPMCWGRGYDQGDFNFVVRSQWDELDVMVMDCDSPFNTMQYCTRKSNITDGSYLLSRSGSPLIYAHQYNRFKEAEDFVKSVCPIVPSK